MSYFMDGFSKDKLTILFFLDTLGTELTREQITTAAAEREIVPFFELQSAVYEMEEAGFLAAVPRTWGQVYAVTEKGRETLMMFLEQLPISLREDLANYADECREKLLRETQFSSCYEKSSNGGYLATLKILERNDILLQVSILLPDADNVRAICRKWPDRAESVYKSIISELHNG
ncbi:MAG: DUF4364 family protein [Clostridia bacterium]